jgi:hypothetical protein
MEGRHSRFFFDQLSLFRWALGCDSASTLVLEMVGLRVLSERCYPMLIMYNREISLRGISLRNPSQTREERGLAPGGGERWTGQRRALNELVPVRKLAWGTFLELSCDGRGDDQSERQT